VPAYITVLNTNKLYPLMQTTTSKGEYLLHLVCLTVCTEQRVSH